MARMKDLLHDLENYDQLTLDEQKVIREMYNITKKDVKKIQEIGKPTTEITEMVGE